MKNKITVLEARAIAVDYIFQLSERVGIKIILIDDLTIEISNGWVFFYDTESYVQTGNSHDALMGNLPVFVSESGGEPKIIDLRGLESYQKSDDNKLG